MKSKEELQLEINKRMRLLLAEQEKVIQQLLDKLELLKKFMKGN